MFSFNFWEPVLIFTLINVVMTLGLYITAMSGQLSMATAAIAGAAAYFAGVLTVNFEVSFYLAIFASIIFGALLGGLLALAISNMRDFILKLTTLAFGEAVAVLAYNIDYIGGANSFTGIPLFTGVGVCISIFLISFLITYRFDHSRFGYMARSVRDDPIAASSSGISILNIRVITFSLGSAIIGMAGAVQAHYVLIINPHDLGFFISLNFVIFLLFGGMYSIWGAVFGAVFLSTAPEFLRFSDQYRLILYGLIIVIVVLVRPYGMIKRIPLGRFSSHKNIESMSNDITVTPDDVSKNRDDKVRSILSNN